MKKFIALILFVSAFWSFSFAETAPAVCNYNHLDVFFKDQKRYTECLEMLLEIAKHAASTDNEKVNTAVKLGQDLHAFHLKAVARTSICELTTAQQKSEMEDAIDLIAQLHQFFLKQQVEYAYEGLSATGSMAHKVLYEQSTHLNNLIHYLSFYLIHIEENLKFMAKN